MCRFGVFANFYILLSYVLIPLSICSASQISSGVVISSRSLHIIVTLCVFGCITAISPITSSRTLSKTSSSAHMPHKIVASTALQCKFLTISRVPLHNLGGLKLLNNITILVLQLSDIIDETAFLMVLGNSETVHGS